MLVKMHMFFSLKKLDFTYWTYTHNHNCQSYIIAKVVFPKPNYSQWQLFMII